MASKHSRCWPVVIVFALGIGGVAANGEEKPQVEPTTIKMAEGKLSLTAPKPWKVKKPRNRIIAFEFAAPAVEGDSDDGRLTVMRAGGSIDDNIARWKNQFTLATGESAKVDEKKIADQQVHVVDISGTFADRRGPFAPAVKRENYRMLGAIIVTDYGQYFVKFYGPRKTIAANEKAFDGFLNSLTVK